MPPGKSADLIPQSLVRRDGPARSPLCLEVEAADLDDALARTLLTITFDGAETPQVAVPLGEFFGSGPGLNPFESAINRVAEDGTDDRGLVHAVPQVAATSASRTSPDSRSRSSGEVLGRAAPRRRRTSSTSTPAGDTRTTSRR